MKKILLLLFLFLNVFFITNTDAQNNDCTEADVICNDAALTFNPGNTGNINDFANPNNDEGCNISGELQSAWYYFEIAPNSPPNATLSFQITPSPNVDYDFAIYGPGASCGNLGSPIRCSFASPTSAGTNITGLSTGASDNTEGAGGNGQVAAMTVQPNQGYFLFINNFSTNNTPFTMDWGGNAILDCVATPPCNFNVTASNDITKCQGATTPTSINASVSGTVVGATTYSWTPTTYLNTPNAANSTVTIPATFNGQLTYQVIAINSGCQDTDIVVINITPLPQITINPAGPFCTGAGAQTLSATPPGGTWAGPNTSVGGTFNTNIAGTYTVTYTVTQNGCSASATQTIVVSQNPMPTIAPVAPLCSTANPITLNAVPAGGTWGGSVSSNQFNPQTLGPGTYPVTYTVTQNGCTNTATINIVINATPTPVITPPPPLCAGQGNVQLSATPTPGTWGGVANAQGIINTNTLTAGTYTVIYAATANGCNSSTSISITIGAGVTPTITPAGPFCTGIGVQNLSASPAGGTWGGAATAAGTFNPTTVGTYTVSYTVGGGGCPGTATATISVTNGPTPTIDPPGTICKNGGTIQMTGSPAGGTWGGVANAAGIVNPATLNTGNQTVTYTVTSGGCTGTATATISIVNPPNVNINPSGPHCATVATVVLSGSPIGGTWSGATTNGILNPPALGPGSYVVNYTYTDNNGCTSSNSTTVVINATPTPTISAAGPFCPGPGIQQLVGSPAGGNWSGAASSTGNFNPTTAGNYVVNYSVNVNGCNGSTSATVVVSQGAQVTIDQVQAICKNGDPIQMTASPSGGTWGGTPNALGIINPATLTPGTYTVTYSVSGSGCSGSSSISVSIVNPAAITINPAGPFCASLNSANITASPPGGIWSGAITTGNFSPALLGAGSHIVTYTYLDNNGCTNSANATIVVNATPTPTISAAGPFCPGQGVQQLVGSPAGGNWSGAASSTGTFNPTTAGNYIVNYSVNVNGCTASTSATVVVSTGAQVTIDQVQAICKNGDPIQMTASPSGGTWGGTANALGIINPATLTLGTYTVTYSVTGGGCSGSSSISVSIVNPAAITINPAGPFCASLNSANITASPPGGTWSGAITTGNFSPALLGAGSHIVTYTYLDNNGCTNSANTTIVVNAIPTPTIAAAGPFCVNDGVQQLTASPTGGNWSGAASSTGTFNPNVGVGFYNAIYTYSDGAGCSAKDTLTIEVTNNPNVTIQNPSPLCSNGTSVTLVGSPAGGTWGGVANASGGINPATLGVGNHQVTYNYTSASGCGGSTAITVTVAAAPNASITQAGPFCVGQGVQNIVATPAGGTWSGAVSSGQFTPNTVGSFSATYIAALATCYDTATTTLVVNNGATPTIATVPPLCLNGTDVTLNGTPTGGTWSGDAPTSGIISPATLGVGNHVVTYSVSNNGCSGSTTAAITVLAIPTATLTGGGVICQGSNQTVNLMITSVGQSPLTVIYTYENTPLTPVIMTNSSYTLPVNAIGTYALQSVVDNNGCSGTVSGTAVVSANGAPTVSNIDTDCNNTNTAYTLTFTISGGNASSYVVTGGNGTISSTAPYIFTSTPIPSGQGYSFVVNDANNCAPFPVQSPPVSCDCATEVGTMSNTLLTTCGTTSCLTATYDDTNEALDGNDVQGFVLHTGNGASLGTVIGTDSSPTFCFDAAAMTIGTTYYISAVVGDDDGTGNVNLNDDCLQVAQGTPIIFYAIPTATISSQTNICAGDTATVTITLSGGTAPYTVSYAEGGNLPTIINNIASSPYTFTVTPSITTTYSLVAFSDANCSGNGGGTATVSVNQAVQVNNIVTNCNNTNTAFTVTFDISGGIASSYNVSGGMGAISNGVFTSTPIPSGQSYNFIVTDANGCDPVNIAGGPIDCNCATYAGTMTSLTSLILCETDAANVNFNNNEVLDGDDVLIFVLHDSPTGTLGNIIATSSTPDFDFQAGMQYNTTYYISPVAGNALGGSIDFGDGCTSVGVGVPVSFQPEPYAFLSGDTSICIGISSQLTFGLPVTGSYDVTYSNGTTDFSLMGINNGYTLAISPTENTIYNITSVSNAACTTPIPNGTATAAADVTVIVSPPTASNLSEICNGTNTLYTVSFEINNGDVATWDITGGNGNIVGNIFTSNPIASGTAYEFILDDANGCNPNIISNIVVCNCVTSVGTMNTGVIDTCETALVNATYDSSTENLDGDDITEFVLHDGSALPLGDIIASNGTPTFGFNAATMAYNTTYYIAALTGNNNGSNQVSMTDPCLKISQSTPVIFRQEANATVGGTTTICTNGSATLTFTTSGVGPFDVTYNDGVNDIIITGIGPEHIISVSPSATTTYSVVAVNDLGNPNCSNLTPSQAIVTVNSAITAGISGAPYEVCKGETTPTALANLLNDADAGGIWSDVSTTPANGFNAGTGMLNPQNLEAGTYSFRYTIVPGAPCPEDFAEVTFIVYPNPTADAGADYTLSCVDTIAQLGGGNTTTGLVNGYAWTDGNGNVIANTIATSINQAGTYQLAVINAAGCTDEDVVIVDAGNDVPSATPVINPINCHDDNNGGIYIGGITGGQEPYQFSINGSAFESDPYYSALSAGTYDILIQDVAGCTWSETIVLENPPLLEINLGADTTIQYPNGYQFTPNISVASNELDTIFWTNQQYITGGTIFQPIADSLFETSGFSATIIDANGCVASDNIIVYVNRPHDVFFPAAFAPESGNVTNNTFTIWGGDEVVKILELRIFDRWGELVYLNENFDANNPALGWDGRMHGTLMNPAVFVYYARIQFNDGTIETYQGDLSLWR